MRNFAPCLGNKRLYVPVVQWIEYRIPVPTIRVRLPTGIQKKECYFQKLALLFCMPSNACEVVTSAAMATNMSALIIAKTLGKTIVNAQQVGWQCSQRTLLNFIGYAVSTIKGFCHCTGDASQCVGISTQRHCHADTILIVGAFQKTLYGYWHCTHAGFIKAIGRLNARYGEVHIIAQPFHVLLYGVFGSGIASQPYSRCSGYSSANALLVIVRNLCRGCCFNLCRLEFIKRPAHCCNAHSCTVAETVVWLWVGAYEPFFKAKSTS